MKCLKCQRDIDWDDLGFRYEDIHVCNKCHGQEEPMNREQGIKQDSGKPRWELVPMKALEGIALVMQDAIEPTEQFPNGRYEKHSWQKVDPRRYLAALVRHVAELQNGQEYTEDTKMRVIDAVLTNAMFLSWFLQRGYDVRKLVPEGQWDTPNFMVNASGCTEPTTIPECIECEEVLGASRCDNETCPTLDEIEAVKRVKAGSL